MTPVRVVLPYHLRTLAGVDAEVLVQPAEPTLGAVLDALEQAHPVLAGTVRDRVSGRRRPFVRFFACRQDLSSAGPDDVLPDSVRRGEEPLLVVGAMAGG